MKFRLEFMAIVSTDRVQAKQEFLDHVVDEPDGVFPSMLWIDSQGSDTGCIVDYCVLITLQLATAFVYKSKNSTSNLYVMTRDLFLAAFIGGQRELQVPRPQTYLGELARDKRHQFAGAHGIGWLEVVRDGVALCPFGTGTFIGCGGSNRT